MPPGGDWGSSPTPGKAVEVEFSVKVRGILGLDQKQGTAFVDVRFMLSWTDHRIVDKVKGNPLWKIPKQLWKPGLELANGFEEEKAMVHALPRLMIEDKQTGRLSMWLTFTGTISCHMDLKNFPFDEESLDFRCIGSRLRDGSNANASDFVLRAKQSGCIEFLFDNNLPEYEILGCSYVEYTTAWNMSYVTWGIYLRRKAQHYFFKVTYLMWLIAALAFPTFLFKYEELEQRMMLVATMFLATSTILYVISEDLPKTEKLNKMDTLLLGTLMILFLAGVESVYVHRSYKSNLAQTQFVERCCVVGLPALYILLNVVLFIPPAYRLVMNGKRPQHQAYIKERVFIPWKNVDRFNPWGVGEGSIITSERPSSQSLWRKTRAKTIAFTSLFGGRSSAEGSSLDEKRGEKVLV